MYRLCWRDLRLSWTQVMSLSHKLFPFTRSKPSTYDLRRFSFALWYTAFIAKRWSRWAQWDEKHHRWPKRELRFSSSKNRDQPIIFLASSVKKNMNSWIIHFEPGVSDSGTFVNTPKD
ncbi:unnamed protein product [Brassica oleracea]